MKWLVTGGAGYIGSHIVRALTSDGIDVSVLDDLTTGGRERVPDGVRLAVGSVRDGDLLREVLRGVDGVIHLAAKKSVQESLKNPLHYYRENVSGLESLLQAMHDMGVDRIILSSSAAVYGMSVTDVVTEDTPTAPTNPYGMTKLICERMVEAVGNATGLRWLALRYFNVGGAEDRVLADRGATNLIPLVFGALSGGERPFIFGADYPTPDGTCIRDFVHVSDVANAHVAAVRAVCSTYSRRIYNVGRGEGASVLDVVRAATRAAGVTIAPEIVDRRPGDPPRVVADARRIQAELGWHAQKDLADIVDSAWKFSAHPCRPGHAT
jgi:UDP-glucose 4-epimerase